MSYVISFRKVGLLLSLVLGVMMLSSCSKDTSKNTKPAASETKRQRRVRIKHRHFYLCYKRIRAK